MGEVDREVRRDLPRGGWPSVHAEVTVVVGAGVRCISGIPPPGLVLLAFRELFSTNRRESPVAVWPSRWNRSRLDVVFLYKCHNPDPPEARGSNQLCSS